MRPLASLERLLERLLERPAARLFRTAIQPVQIQRRIERAMDRERRAEGRRSVVPDRFVVHLAAVDLAGFGPAAGEVAGGLADEALVFARSRGYVVAERPRVELVADGRIAPGDVRVAATFAAERRPDGGAAVPDETMVFDLPAVRAPTAILRQVLRDGSVREVPVDGTLLTIGRDADNGLVLDGPRVSRHHARLRARHGLLVLTDLGSANGVRVNGTRVSEAALGAGDRIEIGDTVLVVETVADG